MKVILFRCDFCREDVKAGTKFLSFETGKDGSKYIRSVSIPDGAPLHLCRECAMTISRQYEKEMKPLPAPVTPE